MKDLAQQISTSAHHERSSLHHKQGAAVVGNTLPPSDTSPLVPQQKVGNCVENPINVDVHNSPVPKPKSYDILYSITTKVRDRDKVNPLDDFALNKTTLADIFHEVSSHTSGIEDLSRVRFELESNSSDISYEVSRDDQDRFEKMKEEFAWIVRKDLKEKESRDKEIGFRSKDLMFRVVMKPVIENIVKQEPGLTVEDVEEVDQIDI